MCALAIAAALLAPFAQAAARRSPAQQEEPVPPEKPGKTAPPDADGLDLFERPTRTVSPHVCGKEVVVFEAGLELAWSDSQTRALTTPALLRLGLSDAVELYAQADVLVSRQADENASGFGDFIVGGKWVLVREAFAAVALWKLPTADEDKELGTGETDLHVLLTLGKHVQSDLWLGVNAGLGFVGDSTESEQFQMQYIASAEGRISAGELILIGELRYASEIEPMSGVETTGLAGVAWMLSEGARVDISVRFGLSKDADDVAFAVGLSFAPGRS